MKIPQTIRSKDPKNVEQAWQQLSTLINQHISFGDGIQADNIRGKWITTTTPVTPDTDFVLPHDLGTIPVGVDLKMKSASCDVYIGSVQPTDTQITLRATAGNVLVRLFIH